jgi:hypothetical protein
MWNHIKHPFSCGKAETVTLVLGSSLNCVAVSAPKHKEVKKNP